MAKATITWLLYRVALPFALLTAVLLRFSVISLTYLILLLVNPLLPGPCGRKKKPAPALYLKVVAGTCTMVYLGHITYQLLLLVTSTGDSVNMPDMCSNRERILAILGLYRLKGLAVLEALRLFGIDFVIFVIAVISHIYYTRQDDNVVDGFRLLPPAQRLRRRSILYLFGELLVLVLMAAAGILHASLTSMTYFLSFLCVATWLSLHHCLDRSYHISRCLLMLYIVFHLIAIYVYQLDYAQEYIPSDTYQARLVGLLALRRSTCQYEPIIGITIEDVYKVKFYDQDWTLYTAPFVVLALYYAAAVMTRLQLLQSQVRLRQSLISLMGSTIPPSSDEVSRDLPSRQPSPLEPGRRVHRPSAVSFAPVDMKEGKQDKGDDQSRSASQDDNLSVSGYAMGPSTRRRSPPPPPTRLTKVISQAFKVLVQCFTLLSGGSHALTMVVMMAWSITYHSWLTFVLLVWSCILWMLPNNRQACLRSSPALVAYAEILLLLQYLYSLDLTDEELPTHLYGTNMNQVGLVKYYNRSYQALFIKILYTIVFWITLHQRVELKHSSPTSESMETAAEELQNASVSGFSAKCECYRKQTALLTGTSARIQLQRLSHPLHQFLTRYWVWVVACSFGLVALGGTKVVVYRVIYLFFFLAFLLTFQLSYSLWVRLMYSFWLVVVIYSMIVLILIYTYQFEKFPLYWETYLGVPREIQHALGLEKYTTYDTFLALLVPTLMLVIIIWQLNWFHQGFIRFNEEYASVKSTPTPQVAQKAPDVVGAGVQLRDPDEPAEAYRIEKEPPRFSFRRPRVSWLQVHRFLSDAMEVVWRLLEIHVIKIVFFSVFYVSVNDVCVLNLVFVLLVVFALPFRPLHFFFSHCCSLWASALFLVKMIYQLSFVDAERAALNCSIENSNDTSVPTALFNSTVNNMMWIGLRKYSDMSYSTSYIALVFMFTIQGVVRYRQRYNRQRNGLPEPKPGIAFPFVKRNNADDNIRTFIKFLVNYGFYKFGVEICFVSMVFCMGNHMDVFALLNSMWLSGLFLLRRRRLSTIWPYYVAYLCVTLPLQYIMVLGLPPELCIDYPWQGSQRNALREIAYWLYLPDYLEPPETQKLHAEFLHLMLACSQLFIFSIENSHNRVLSYQGGSNREIYDRSGRFIGRTPNPIPDFVTYVRSYLSMIQSYVFFSFYWITLAVMFVAGTSQVSIFAMGYVLGCFVFLWNGNDFYLKPMNLLLKKWNMLLAYNVLVIFIKCILQLVGCVFKEYLFTYSCWMVQLLGIVCLRNPVVQISVTSKDMPGALGHSDAGGDVCRPSPAFEGSLFWDGVCLAFLLAQKRLFMSYYFHHLIIEVLVQQRLASRGAEMIHDIKLEDVEEQRAYEQELMKKIKWKTEKLRANQQKMRVRDEEPETHYEAIRSGDYYLFDEQSSVDLEIEIDSVKARRLPDEDADVKVRGINALLSTAIKTGSLRRAPEESSWLGGTSIQEPPASSAESTESEIHHQAPAGTKTVCYAPSKRPPVLRRASSTGFVEAQTEASDKQFSDVLLGYLGFLVALIDSMLISATAKLNEVSRDYRYVARHLAEEKRQDKKRYTTGLATTWDVETVRRTRIHFYETTKQQHRTCPTPRSRTYSVDKQDWGVPQQRPSAIRFLVAFFYAIVSRSEVVCYLIIVMNQIMSASLLSLPLPLMAFLWGSLSVPRPSKTFWITIITYTEAIIVVKYLFQFDFFKWDDTDTGSAFDAPRLIGIDKRKGNTHYALYDLVLLLFVFFHRFMLKGLGLWKDTEGTSSCSESSSTEAFTTALSPTPPERTDANDETDDWGKNDASLNLHHAFDGVWYYTDQFKTFFLDLLHPVYQVTTDVYGYMFLCDFINFMIMVFGYWAFGTGSSEVGVATYVRKNEVPLPYMVMLLAQFGLIVIDRALYLRKYILGKLIFQLLMVLIIHLWMFFVVPGISQRSFVDDRNLPPKLWYFIKCVYLMLSAYQIRCGYPSRILGNFFCKEYYYINYVLFKGYMLVPFLYELRSLMDWIWTDTSMSLGYWFKMEDIFSSVFLTKCLRRAEADYPTPRGENRDSLTKYGLGGLLLIVLILVIWFPLLLFSLANTVGRSLLPSRCSLELGIGGYQPLFRMSLQGNAMQPMPEGSWRILKTMYKSKTGAREFLSNYDAEDVAVITVNGNSTGLWAISPPGRQKLMQQLNDSSIPLQITMKWEITRILSGKNNADQTHSAVEVSPLSDAALRRELSRMIAGDEATDVALPAIFPKYILSSRTGKLEVVGALDPPSSMYRNLTLRLRFGTFRNGSDPGEWWEIQEQCSKGSPYPFLPPEHASCSYLNMIVFCDKVFPQALLFFWDYGIIGMYTTFVLVVSRLLRRLRAGSSIYIKFDDMPNVDRVLQLCLDIYLVRESKELLLEEDLFAKLIFLYRSPETLIKWTRPAQPIMHQPA
ncbi:piezo-type mechanosensitive ion channel component-like isoform X2 [Ornithodoros turicata]|uniref:piezo-type mechanosensitive ion channel component-like isoform X2 n=1 Tax=Ornithodoros turicata TaxID=34597 RepID=UPI0031399C4F